MTPICLCLCLAALSTAPLGAAPITQEAVTLRFAPAPGTTRTTEVSLQQDIDGGLLTCVMNGDPVPEAFLPELHLFFEDECSFAVEEVYLQGDEDGPTEWLRHYASIAHFNVGEFSMSMSGQPPAEMPWDSEADSDLAGSVLRITSADGELEQELVEGDAAPTGLRLDLSFSALLPAEPVEVGDSWDVEDEALALLLEPGGELGLVLDEATRQNLFPDFDSREYAGRLTLTLAEHRQGLARIELEGELARITVGPGDLSQVPVVDGEATDTTTETFELMGEMSWDTAAGALAELSIGGRLETDTVTERDPSLPGSTYASSFSNEGSWSLEVACATAESSVLEAAVAR